MNRQSLQTLAATGLLLMVMLPCCGAADDESSDEWLKRLLADTCKKHNVPSLSVSVVRADEILATACSGVRKRGTNDEVSLSDRHPLGSCTKSMTATLAAVLVEAGKIEWETTIGQVWPGADEKHIHPALQKVTLNELLSHQSGLTSNLGGKDWASFFAEKSRPPVERKRILNLVMKLKPEHPHGEYHYSNLGYVVAAAMLEKKCGDSLEGMMRSKVFQPLKMETADFRTMALAKKLRAPLLWGHRDNGTPMNPRLVGAENPSVYAPCGTVSVSIADYARYAQWHLSNEPAPLLSTQPAFDHLHTGAVDAKSTGGKYGCGWICIDTGYGPALTHAGSNTNSQALIWILPERDFAAVACTNTGERAGFLASDEVISESMKRFAQSPDKG